MPDPVVPGGKGLLSSEFFNSLIPYGLGAGLTAVNFDLPGVNPNVAVVCKTSLMVVCVVAGMVKGLNFANGRVTLKSEALSEGKS
jgi:hypothetical protein